jgi:hypothetical protein
MLIDIYKLLREKKFSSKGQDEINNKRLGIKKSFSKDNYHIEIFEEYFGYTLIIYGGGFSSRYLPSHIDIMDKTDITFLRKELELEFKNTL